MADLETCEQFCSDPIGPNGQPRTVDTKACCPACDRLIGWLSHDVLPAIRKHGFYCPPAAGVDAELGALIGQDGWQTTLERLLCGMGLMGPDEDHDHDKKETTS